MDRPYCYPLAIQLTLPQGFREDAELITTLRILQDAGFTGVELNIEDPESVPPQAVMSFLGEFDLKMTMFASGATARAERLSLSASDKAVRGHSVARCIELVDYASHFRAGIILGLMKGDAREEKGNASHRLVESLSDIAPEAQRKGVAVLVEATNRYEASVANSLDDAAAIVGAVPDAAALRILPDTFHMNIEERDQFDALTRHRFLYDSLHVSDNNRRFPGLGGIDFGRLVRHLDRMGFTGSLAIEGNAGEPLTEDLQKTIAYLSRVLSPEGASDG
jgi:D-psicose/D-tagatose/L-ribulose 3-epimerase